MAVVPSATVILPDLGAEVIKIEKPSGNMWRYGQMTSGLPCTKIPCSTYIRNRTQKSVALNKLVQPPIFS
ncbi:CoA transferase [Desulfopila sp. IMCC35008]|uniref:CoA transferase n=1 Tax=Desulfopila sp. IMCC35008 TaxID=2653858 RepID=UPI0013D8AF84